MANTLNIDDPIRHGDFAINGEVGQKNSNKGRLREHPSRPSLSDNKFNKLPPPNIMVTPATPGIETPSRKPNILHASLDPSKFIEWKTSTRQGILIHFTPLTDTASTDSSTKYSMYTPRNFLERSRRDHTLYLGSSIEGPELGFTRELPHGYLFTVGNPTVPGKTEPECLRWPCENEMAKGGRGVGKEKMRWDFKADLSLYGMGREWVWARTEGLGSGSGINEMELRDGKG